MKTSFVTDTGDNHRVIDFAPITRALGRANLAVLTEFRALSGADITGSFSGKEKLSCWKAFIEAEDIINALGKLGTTLHPPDEILALVEKFRCQLYQPGTGIAQV